MLLLLGSQRTNTVHFFTVDRITVTDIGVKFAPNHVFKHSKPGRKLDRFHFRANHSKHLCVVGCLKEYLKNYSIKVQTDNKALFITYDKPFRAAAIDSMRRWLKYFSAEMSILKEHTLHTCRSAATCRPFGKMSEHSLIFIKRTLYIMYQKIYRLHEHFNMKYLCPYVVYFYFLSCKT